MTGQFRVFAYDFNTTTKLAELPVFGLSFDTQLNTAGACQFSLKLDDPATAAAAAPVLGLDAGTPFKVYIDRDGTIVWGGYAQLPTYTSSTGVLAVGGREIIAYFAQRTIVADYSAATYPSGLDPAQLAYKALTDTQNTALAGPGASAGLNVVGGSSTIPPIVPGYPLSQLTMVSQILSDVAAGLTAGAGGVDLVVTHAWADAVGGTPVSTATIYSPRAGRSAGSTGLFFDLAADGIEYTWPADAGKAGTSLTVFGGGSGTEQLRVNAASPQPVGGLGQYPRLDLVGSFTQVQSAAQLNAITSGLIASNGKAVAVPVVTVPADYPPNPLGAWLIGDDARLFVAKDPFFVNGLDQYWRIVQYATKVPDEGVPTVALTFNRPPQF